jgi:Flp pilus assembly pilin Flp
MDEPLLSNLDPDLRAYLVELMSARDTKTQGIELALVATGVKPAWLWELVGDRELPPCPAPVVPRAGLKRRRIFRAGIRPCAQSSPKSGRDLHLIRDLDSGGPSSIMNQLRKTDKEEDMKPQLKKLLGGQSGQTLVEYGLLVALVALLTLAIIALVVLPLALMVVWNWAEPTSPMGYPVAAGICVLVVLGLTLLRVVVAILSALFWHHR